MKRVLIIPDAHWPFTDQAAWGLQMRVAKVFKPHIIVLMGDFVDFLALSAHLILRQPDLLSVEVQQGHTAIRQLEKLKAERYIYICGNHEFRLDRYLAAKAPALGGLVTIKSLLELNSWEIVPYREFIRIGKVYFTHDVNGRSGKNCLSQGQNDFGASVVTAHTHRMESIYVTTLAGEVYVARSFGWLGAPAARKDYMHAAACKNWVHGCGIGYLFGDGTIHLHDVPFIKGTALVGEKLVR